MATIALCWLLVGSMILNIRLAPFAGARLYWRDLADIAIQLFVWPIPLWMMARDVVLRGKWWY